MKKVTKGHILYYSSYIKISRVGKTIETESNSWLAHGGRNWESDCLMGIGFSFRMMEMFGNLIKVVVQNIMNVLNGTELYTLKCVLC